MPIKSHCRDAMVIYKGINIMNASPVFLGIYCGHSIIWRQKFEISMIFLEVFSWVSFSCGYNHQWRHKDFD